MEKRVWWCVEEGCNTALGEVVGGELRLNENVAAYTHGSNLEVECPKCGANKTWYSNDMLVRAIYQLIDVFVAVAVRKMQRSLNKEDWRQ